MPLSALDQNETIYAFNFSPEDWQALRPRAKDLRFPCCDAGVVLKRSHIGTQFFAHARKGACVTGPETLDHLQAKDVIARAAIAAGWRAATEARGTTPNGERWTADVLISRGKVKIAFEVQLTRQAREATLARHARYEASGVRALWFMKQRDIPDPSKTLPAFAIQPTPDGFQVGVGSTYFGSPPNDWIPLEQFVAGALDKRLVWQPLVGRSMWLQCVVRRRTCNVCGTWNAIPLGSAYGTLDGRKYRLAATRALMDALYPVRQRDTVQLERITEGGPIVWVSCRKCGAGLMDPRDQYGVERNLPAAKVRLTAEMLNAPGNRWATDVWGYLPKSPQTNLP